MESHEYIHTPEESVPQNRIWKEERGGGHLTCPYTVDSIARAEDSVTRAEGVTSTRQRGRTLNSDIGCVTLRTDHDVTYLGHTTHGTVATASARTLNERGRKTNQHARTRGNSARPDIVNLGIPGVYVAAAPWAARLR